VDDVAVLLEHVDLLDGLDRLDVHLLEGGLQLLVIGAGVAGHLLDLAAGSALASVERIQLVEFVRRGRNRCRSHSWDWVLPVSNCRDMSPGILEHRTDHGIT